MAGPVQQSKTTQSVGIGDTPRKAISLWPTLGFVRRYSLPFFRADLQAGATVAIFAVPQVMAYAMLAGVPPVYGLYTVLVASLLGAVWGWSPQISTGPSNSAALLTAAAIASHAGAGDLMSTIFLFGLMVGVIRLLLGLVRAGGMIDYVSEAAMLGFTVGIGTLIAFGQLHHVFGVAKPESRWFVVRLVEVFQQLGHANIAAFLIAAGTWLLMVLLRKQSRRFPVALTAILLATVAVEVLGAVVTVDRVRDIAEVRAGLPRPVFHALDWGLAVDLLPFAVAVAVIGLIEVATIAKVLGARQALVENDNQEFIGQGIAQLGATLFQGIPCSGSFTRSALLEHTGARTRLAGVYLSLCMALALVFIARWLNFIPIASLAGLLFFIGFRLVNVAQVRHVWATSGPDAAIMIITFLVTVFIHIEYGIFTGVIASGVLMLRRARRLQVFEVVPRGASGFEEVVYDEMQPHAVSAIVALDIHGNLFYAQAAILRDQLDAVLERQQVQWLVIRMRRVYSMDYSCWGVLQACASELRQRGGGLLVCDLQSPVLGMFERGGMDDVVPAEHLIPETGSQYGALRNAVRTIPSETVPPARLSGAWREWLADNAD